MYNYTIMKLDIEHIDEICKDIYNQCTTGVASMPLFSMTLVPVGNPPAPKTEILCDVYKQFKSKLDAMGVKSGVLVQASIGHGYPLPEMFPYQQYINTTNGEAMNTVCPYDESFREHFRHNMEVIASCHPDMIMVDDDLRLMFRPGKGCCCPKHLEKISKMYGKPLAREDVLKAIEGNSPEDKKITEIYINRQLDALYGAAKAMREGIDRVDDTLPGSFCCVGLCCEGAEVIAKILAGKGNPSIVRINNGNYTSEGARYFTRHMYRAASSIALLKEKVDAILAETDTCPQNRYSTGAQSLHAHFTGSILEGCTGAKHWITRLASFEPSSGKAYRKKLGENAGFYEELSKLSPHINWLGCRIPLPKKPDYALDKESNWCGSDGWYGRVLERLGFPMYFSPNDGGALFMEDDNDQMMTDEEILKALSGTVFITSDCAERLCKRGFSEHLGVTVEEYTGKNPSGELLHDINMTTKPQTGIRKLIPTDTTVRELSTIYHSPDEKNITPLMPGVTAYKNSLGGFVCVFAGITKVPYHFTTAFSFLNESRKKQLSSLLKESGNLPVYYTEDAEVYLKAGTMPDGGLLVAVFNLGFDILDTIPLQFEKDINSISMLTSDGTLKNVDFSIEDGIVDVKEKAYTLEPVILFVY